MLGLDAQIVQRADDLQPAKNPQNAIIFTTGRLRIQMRSNIDRQRVWVRPFAPRKHVAHLIQPHGAARILAPLLEQCAAFTIFIRQRLAVVAARDARSDLGHFHQAIPQTIWIDFQVLSGRGHGWLLW